jgi:hypothetical protein
MSDRTTPNGIIITAHALISLLRHGFQDPFGFVDDIIGLEMSIGNYSRRMTQDDGTTVYIQQTNSQFAMTLADSLPLRIRNSQLRFVTLI